jgi:hypothetical protein
MTASFDRSECVLVTGSEAVRGEAVGCIAWLGLQGVFSAELSHVTKRNYLNEDNYASSTGCRHLRIKDLIQTFLLFWRGSEAHSRDMGGIGSHARSRGNGYACQ